MATAFSCRMRVLTRYRTIAGPLPARRRLAKLATHTHTGTRMHAQVAKLMQTLSKKCPQHCTPFLASSPGVMRESHPCAAAREHAQSAAGWTLSDLAGEMGLPAHLFSLHEVPSRSCCCSQNFLEREAALARNLLRISRAVEGATPELVNWPGTPRACPWLHASAAKLQAALN